MSAFKEGDLVYRFGSPEPHLIVSIEEKLVPEPTNNKLLQKLWRVELQSPSGERQTLSNYIHLAGPLPHSVIEECIQPATTPPKGYVFADVVQS